MSAEDVSAAQTAATLSTWRDYLLQAYPSLEGSDVVELEALDTIGARIVLTAIAEQGQRCQTCQTTLDQWCQGKIIIDVEETLRYHQLIPTGADCPNAYQHREMEPGYWRDFLVEHYPALKDHDWGHTELTAREVERKITTLVKVSPAELHLVRMVEQVEKCQTCIAGGYVKCDGARFGLGAVATRFYDILTIGSVACPKRRVPPAPRVEAFEEAGPVDEAFEEPSQPEIPILNLDTTAPPWLVGGKQTLSDHATARGVKWQDAYLPLLLALWDLDSTGQGCRPQQRQLGATVGRGRQWVNEALTVLEQLGMVTLKKKSKHSPPTIMVRGPLTALYQTLTVTGVV